jgi:hypothetical protein
MTAEDVPANPEQAPIGNGSTGTETTVSGTKYSLSRGNVRHLDWNRKRGGATSSTWGLDPLQKLSVEKKTNKSFTCKAPKFDGVIDRLRRIPTTARALVKFAETAPT